MECSSGVGGHMPAHAVLHAVPWGWTPLHFHTHARGWMPHNDCFWLSFRSGHRLLQIHAFHTHVTGSQPVQPSSEARGRRPRRQGQRHPPDPGREGQAGGEEKEEG